jgi:hypothetical protein
LRLVRSLPATDFALDEVGISFCMLQPEQVGIADAGVEFGKLLRLTGQWHIVLENLVEEVP